MSDQTFLQMLVERAQNVVALQKRGRTRKAAAERHAIYRDIDFYCKKDTARIAMYEKLMLYHLEEYPALWHPPRIQLRRPQKRKDRFRERSF